MSSSSSSIIPQDMSGKQTTGEPSLIRRFMEHVKNNPDGNPEDDIEVQELSNKIRALTIALQKWTREAQAVLG